MLAKLGAHNSSFRPLVFWLGLAVTVGLFYLAVSAWGYGYSGFPLDDAWIHQTYARNLARSGQLAFTPGVPSAGSTAPLWSLLLSLGYLLGLPFQIWTYGLGLVFLALTGWTMARLGQRLFPEHRRLGLLAGLFCLFEWHLVWAAVSGMETILFVWLSTFLFERYLCQLAISNYQLPISNLQPPTSNLQPPTSNLQPPISNPQSPIQNPKSKIQNPKSKIQNPLLPYFTLGILGGLLSLTRPEGLGLIGLIGLDLAYRRWSRRTEKPGFWGEVLHCWVLIAAGLALLLIPYMGFHLWTTGRPFPNTFYAKQTEYRLILDSFSLWRRLFGNWGPPVETAQGVFRVIFIGAQFLLLPGLFGAAWLTVKERRLALIPVWLWWISYLLLYGLRLPVTYQHGRYQIPAISWVLLLGVWGTVRLVVALSRRGLVWRVLGRTLALSLLILTPAFTVVGAQAYGRDVRLIESEMVATARWLQTNTPPSALIAAHDIGAIGYFTQRPLIDLAGLITPEVIPFIRDEAALLDFIIARQADYLVTFPSWYPELTQNPALNPIYSTQAPWAPQAGGDNMTVYRINMVLNP